MPKGGARQGTAGTAYPNRSDMQSGQAPAAPSGGEYGDRKRMEDLQRAIPLPNQADQIIPIGAPTQRPDEPTTSGVPLGPGPGPEALGIQAGGDDDTALQLRAIYRLFPSEDVRRLIELYDQGF